MERKVCTIGEWLDVWYEVYAVPEYAPKTLEIYRDARKRLSRRFPEIESTLQSALEFAAYRRVSPHMLRHTFATRMIENGSDAKSLALIIGHSNPAFTLRRYVHPDHTSLYEQMCRLSSVQQ